METIKRQQRSETTASVFVRPSPSSRCLKPVQAHAPAVLTRPSKCPQLGRSRWSRRLTTPCLTALRMVIGLIWTQGGGVDREEPRVLPDQGHDALLVLGSQLAHLVHQVLGTGGIVSSPRPRSPGVAGLLALRGVTTRLVAGGSVHPRSTPTELAPASRWLSHHPVKMDYVPDALGEHQHWRRLGSGRLRYISASVARLCSDLSQIWTTDTRSGSFAACDTARRWPPSSRCSPPTRWRP